MHLHSHSSPKGIRTNTNSTQYRRRKCGYISNRTEIWGVSVTWTFQSNANSWYAISPLRDFSRSLYKAGSCLVKEDLHFWFRVLESCRWQRCRQWPLYNSCPAILRKRSWQAVSPLLDNNWHHWGPTTTPVTQLMTKLSSRYLSTFSD